MATILGQRDPLAQAVARRAAEVLSAPVRLVDRRGVVAASSDPAEVGALLDWESRVWASACLRTRIRFGGEEHELIVGQPAAGETISPRLACAVVDMAITEVSVVGRLPNPHDLKNKFIFDLLRGTSRDDADILREGQILGMDLTRPRAVILVDAAEYVQASGGATARGGDALAQQGILRARHVVASIVQFFQLPDDTICAYIGDGEIAVLKASSTRDLAAWAEDEEQTDEASLSWANLRALKRAGAALLARLRHETHAAVSIGIGRYHPGIRQLSNSYEDARAALALGRGLYGHNRVYSLDGLGVAAFVGLSDQGTKVELAAHLLSPLAQQPELLETLQVFFDENCSASATAQRLFLHRNSLSYRLEKIASLIGLDPRRFDEALQIRLALILCSLRAGEMPPGECPISDPETSPSAGQPPGAMGTMRRSA